MMIDIGGGVLMPEELAKPKGFVQGFPFDQNCQSLMKGKRDRTNGFNAPVYSAKQMVDAQSEYQTAYVEAIEVSNDLGFAGMSAADVIRYQAQEAADLKARLANLVADCLASDFNEHWESYKAAAGPEEA